MADSASPPTSPRLPCPPRAQITSTTQLTTEFSLLLTALAKEETEHTWEQIDKALKRFQAVIRGGACKFTDDFVRQMRAKEVVVGIVRSVRPSSFLTLAPNPSSPAVRRQQMETERTRLSATTLLLLSSLTRLGPSFAPLLPLFLPPLLRLLCRTNKLYLSRAASTLSSIVVHTRLPEILKFVVGEWKAEGGKSASYRTGATAVVLSMLEGGEEMAVEKDGIERRMDELEWVIRTGATDKEQKVRAEIKKVWERYKREWPERVAGCVIFSHPSFDDRTNDGAAQVHRTDDPRHPSLPRHLWRRSSLLVHPSSRRRTS